MGANMNTAKQPTTALGVLAILILMLACPMVVFAANPGVDKGLVDYPISINVWKTANPAFVESGNTVIFRLAVFNTSARDTITITTMQDDVFGNLDGQGDCSVPSLVVPGNSYSCTFPGIVAGAAGTRHTNTIQVTANDARSRMTSGSDNTTIDLVAAPVSIGTAEISNVALTGAVIEPGEDVTMRVDIFNTGSANVTITAMIDDVFGNIDGQGSCALPQIVPQNPDSGVYTCTYPALITGTSGSIHSNTLTATGSDTSGNPINSTDTTTVEILGAPTGGSTAVPVPGLGSFGLLIAALLMMVAGATAIIRQQVQ